MPKIELVRAKRTKPESTYISKFARNVTSQYGEDGVIEKILELIGSANRWCVEFGAWDGKYLSNTWTLVNNERWSGVLIEGDSERAAALGASMSDRTGEVFVENAYVSWEGHASLDNILGRTPIPANFDVLSIDIDGNDWHVWDGLKNYRPRLVVVEFNPSAGNELSFVQDPDPALNQGSSLLAFVLLAKEKGYELAATTYFNAFFVLAEDFGKLNIADNSIDAMYEPYMDIQICQGYDGTIFAAGHLRLTWHGVELTQEDFQMLPAAMRKYPDPGKQS
ncbi:MAG: hypothetical protein EON54_09040 [Alcaligenaceae bacterium]|nr:MAG: hypothetical protein EON54_09040 [Alcaligenaceae bacterium]